MMRTRTRGFTLIEVLVALLVLGIGLLGVAGLQSATMGLNHGSYLRSQATVLAQDIVDRMRSNPRATANGNYDQGTASQNNGCTDVAGCTTTDMAGHDLYQWQAAVADQLPNGEGVVCIDSTPNDGDGAGSTDNDCDGTGDVRVVKLWWYSKEEDETHRFVTEVRPQ